MSVQIVHCFNRAMYAVELRLMQAQCSGHAVYNAWTLTKMFVTRTQAEMCIYLTLPSSTCTVKGFGVIEAAPSTVITFVGQWIKGTTALDNRNMFTAKSNIIIINKSYMSYMVQFYVLVKQKTTVLPKNNLYCYIYITYVKVNSMFWLRS